MQKFIVVKNIDTPVLKGPDDLIPTMSPIKICGYLKKKRNRMGGWRKMWFVLQNQLLLSYSSKEDYEKKLVPFKDVINLGPGTIIIPTAGLPRFTIETATNIFYTFRCDDCKTSAEWITALVESISVEAKTNKIAKRLSFQNKFHSSDEMLLPIELRKTPPKISRSCDSIYQNIKTIRNMDASGKCPKLPIALGTARILERCIGGGVCQKHILKDMPCDVMVHNFRLHDENLERPNHSTDVCRINSMFKSTNSITTTAAATTSTTVTAPTLTTESSSSVVTPTSSTTTKISASTTTTTTTETVISPSTTQTSEATATETTPVTPLNCTVLKTIQQNCEIYLNTSCIHQKKKMEKLENDNKNDKNELVDFNENLINSNTSEIAIEERLQKIKIIDDDNIVDLDLNARDSLIIDSVSVHDLLQDQANNEEISVLSDNCPEPIYAVVNLKSKHASRAKKLELSEERPKSAHITTSDYEDVNTFSIDFSDEEGRDEHIYEPITLPEIPNNQRSMLWHNIRKINIDAFMDMTKRMRESKDKTPTSNAKSNTTFSELGRKFGNHRRSIKNQVRKLYSRDQRSTGTDTDVSSTSTDNHNSDELSTISMPPAVTNSIVRNGAEKYRKGERQFFGSFGRMKKSRTSLCFDETNVKKPVARKNDSLQQELKKEFEKRKEDEKNKMCHSIFYS